MDLQDTYVIGVDEAGLGPLLGPLVVGYSVCRISDFGHKPSKSGISSQTSNRENQILQTIMDYNIWRSLDPLLSDDPKQVAHKIVVCDSKKLHTSKRGMARLEENLLPLVFACGERRKGSKELGQSFGFDNFSGYWKALSFVQEEVLAAYPWYQRALSGEEAMGLPLQGLKEKIQIRGVKAIQEFEEKPVAVEELGILPVLVGEFNRLIRVHKNKADAHFSAIAQVVEYAWRKYSKRSSKIIMICDRLGGRIHYKSALQVHLKAQRIDVLEERQERSAYRVIRNAAKEQQELTILFLVRGESLSFSVALASMIAKYTRELCVELINRYFLSHQPELKPTKGYVQDGRRFLQETKDLRRSLKIPEELFIRIR